jgi:hypothetical protein
MNKKVICINDKKLPPGAEVKEGVEYIVRETFINNFDQIVYLLIGVRNLGRTQYGLPWEGYNSKRFEEVDCIEKTESVYDYAIN